MSLLGIAVGRALSVSDGLNAAYLPEGVPLSIAQGIVRGANLARGGVHPPFAILVDDGPEDLSDEQCLQMSSNAAIQYRTGNRLAVVLGHPDLSSFEGSFLEVIEPDYPLSSDTGLGLDDLSRELIELVVQEAGLQGVKYWDVSVACERLVEVLLCLSDAYRSLGQGTASWNTYWFRHVDRGLKCLAQALTARATHDRNTSLDNALADLTYAAFSLPKPRSGVSYGGTKTSRGKQFVDALSLFWGDQQAIEATAKQLKYHPQHEPKGHAHALEGVDWSNLGRLVAGLGNPLLAWATAPDDDSAVSRVAAFAELKEEEFFHPHLGIDADPTLRLSDATGNSFGVDGFDGPQVVPATYDVEGRSITSILIRVAIPTTELPGADSVAASTADLEPRGARSSWVGKLVLRDGQLWAEGRLSVRVTGEPAKLPVRPLGLSLAYPSDDALTPYLGRSASPSIHLVPAGSHGVLYFVHRANGSLGPAQFGGSDLVAPKPEDLAAAFQESLDGGSQVTVMAFGDAREQTPSVADKALTAISDHRSIWLGTFVSSGLDTLSLGDLTVEWQAPEAAGEHQSPLLAALDRSVVSARGPDPAALSSVRGQVESYMAENVSAAGLLLALGHIATIEGEPTSFADLDLGPDQALLMDPRIKTSWLARTNFSVPVEIVHGEEAQAFRASAEALGLAERLREADGQSGAAYRWPSRASWRHLWADGDTLEAYLHAYAALVARARAMQSPEAVFWAAYPFSVSAWTTQAGAKCRAVMLTPLHPIRLAWLAGVEQVLWNAQDPHRLAGIVEGWNFPLLGPRNNTNGRMMAVPIDTGEGQVFTGWSMLVDASVNGHAPLEAPSHFGNLPAPGSSASGLNASAVDGALRTYRRMNPHVSTLTIDLAASSPGPRLQEVDRAILSSIGAWKGKPGAAPRGGIRVRDSLNRLGDVPRAELDRVLAERSGIPIMWTRYKPDPANGQESNLRLLQDAGVGIEVSSGHGDNDGLVGGTPIRRYEVPQSVSAAISTSRPALRHGMGWEPLSKALAVIEMAETVPVVDAQLFQSAIVDPAAEWTVCGESMLSPGALAPMVAANAGGRQMLWEWRPPFLDKEGGALLERRPFVSVVRIPAAFRKQVQDLLEKAQGTPVSDDQVEDLLGALGARGVGLSSLMAMGGTHAAGALGFYLAFRLMDHVRLPDSEHVVIPIDACDSFLRALADGGAAKDADSLRRADLLVIRIEKRAIRLIPIEIKFYGLNAASPSPYLPSTTSSKLNEPLDQLSSTMTLLNGIRAKHQGFSRTQMEPQHELWVNALTTLLEAGMRLRLPNSADTSLLGEALELALGGGLSVELGRPLLCYFGHEATTSSGERFEHFTNVVHPGYPTVGAIGGLLVNTAAAFEGVEDSASRVCEGWVRVVQWAGSPETDPDADVRLIESPPNDDFERTSDEDAQADKTRPERPANEGWPPVPVPEAEDEQPTPETEPVLDASADATPDPIVQEIAGQGIRFPIGTPLNQLSNDAIRYWPSNTRLNQLNVGVVGDLGTGKTQFLKAFTYQLRRQSGAVQPTPISMLVFDYKRDFQDPEFLAAVGGKVLKPFRIPLNIFALHSDYTPQVGYQRARAFVDILAKIYRGIGPIQKNRLTLAIKDLYAEKNGGAPTISEVLDRYRESVGTEDSVTSCLDIFVLGEIFGDEPTQLQSFKELLQDSVTVVALNELGQDQDTKNALVVLFLNMYFEYMHGLTKWPFEGGNPQLRRINSMLLVDEATNIMKYEFPVLMDLMLQGREFGAGVILASQYLSHFKAGSTNYGQPLLTWLIHKVPSVSGRELRALGLTNATDEHAKVVSELGVHEALCSTLDVSTAFIRGIPFYELISEVSDAE